MSLEEDKVECWRSPTGRHRFVKKQLTPTAYEWYCIHCYPSQVRPLP